MIIMSKTGKSVITWSMFIKSVDYLRKKKGEQELCASTWMTLTNMLKDVS